MYPAILHPFATLTHNGKERQREENNALISDMHSSLQLRSTPPKKRYEQRLCFTCRGTIVAEDSGMRLALDG